MDNTKGKILWVDDEIELLKSHVLFLKDKGYDVYTVTNGEDAISSVANVNFDLIFLDEMMAGMGGLETLAKIKENHPSIPVVMITKNEEERLMEDAIGSKISDYLTKPINPSQVLLTAKKFLEAKKISAEYISRDYIKEFQEITRNMMFDMNYEDWIDTYLKLVSWELELDDNRDLGLHQSIMDQKRECNSEFAKFVDKNYKKWINGSEDKPILSNEVFEQFVAPELGKERSVFFFVIDCMRLDQWQIMEKELYDIFNISKNYYYSILPTATPFSRNSLFSGLFPSEIEQRYPDMWKGNEDDENSLNKFEPQLLEKLLERMKVKLKRDLKYIKILDTEFGKQIEQTITNYTNNDLTAIVINFVDMLAHGRSDSALLKEISPDEPAYRSLTYSWFIHSSFLNMLKALSKQKNVTVVITTDHGSIRCMRGTKVLGDREASTNLRYKFGRNLKCDDKQAIFVKNPQDYKLPRRGITINYIIAKEDYYFVYPTEYHKYLSYYKDTFQHGGISMEEMILPVITLKPKL
jgi:CheY-like chemotaxis protein